jgi:hypothetical protein
MSELEYLMMLRTQLYSRRVICGVSKDESGRTIVTTCEPRQYNDGITTYVNQRTMSYDDYLAGQFQIGFRKRR